MCEAVMDWNEAEQDKTTGHTIQAVGSVEGCIK
jgi:hypothetical protein